MSDKLSSEVKKLINTTAAVQKLKEDVLKKKKELPDFVKDFFLKQVKAPQPNNEEDKAVWVSRLNMKLI